MLRPGETFKMCGVQGCCPTVERDADKVIFRDDFGGKVVLTIEQWDDLVSRIKTSS